MHKKTPRSPIHRMNHWIWLGKPQAHHWQFAQRMSRSALYVLRELLKGNLQQNALGLSYITLLSLVPLLAVSFSVLKAFGSDQVIEPFLTTLLEPLGHSAPELTERITGFVSNIKVGVLGTVGIALLFYTVIALLQKIETVFNGIWHVQRLRQLATRIPMYLSVVLVGPVLILAAIGFATNLFANEWVQSVTHLGGLNTAVSGITQLLPFLLWIIAFTLIYKALPNTHVNFSAALVGGTVAALLWNGVGLAFGTMMAGSVQYTAIYSAFASAVLFMVWLQLAWLIVLLGASVSFAWQRTDQLAHTAHSPLNPHHQLMVAALEALSVIDARFEAGLPPPSTEEIKTHLAHLTTLDPWLIDQAAEALQTAQLIYPHGREPSGWLPARSAKRISVADIRAALWGNPLELTEIEFDAQNTDAAPMTNAPPIHPAHAGYHPMTQQWLTLEQNLIEPQLRALTLEANHAAPPQAQTSAPPTESHSANNPNAVD